jgi:twitching motility protein PilT
VDFAYSIANVGRFRANVFRQRGSVSMVLRKLRFGGPSFEEMGLPDAVRKLADEHRGLILVTGPTGSGKTTTLAAMIAYINQTKPVHIVTIEDPIEVLHRDDVASINQREIGNDTEDFLAALRAALRQDPDVILIGEMRDTETVRAALQAAETGHLVLSTLHTTDATETVNRVIDFFPPYQQKQVRLALAASLRGIVCQAPRADVDGGRVPALEILVNTVAWPSASRTPTRPRDQRGDQGRRVLRDGHLRPVAARLIQEGTVSVADAMQAVSSRHDFELAMQQAGIAVPCSSGHDPSPPRRCDTEPGEDADGRPDRRRCDPATLVGRGVERSDRRRRVRWCDVGDRDRGPVPRAATVADHDHTRHARMVRTRETDRDRGRRTPR